MYIFIYVWSMFLYSLINLSSHNDGSKVHFFGTSEGMRYDTIPFISPQNTKYLFGF